MNTGMQLINHTGKRGRIKCFLIGMALWAALPAGAQPPVIKASLDSTQLLIGEQTLLHLEIAANKESRLQLPLLTDTLTQGVEILEISQPDTTDIGNNRMQIRYDYLITSFDSALYRLPPFQLISETDTFYSNDLALKVSTLPVDVNSGQYYDIKDIMSPPLVLADYVYILLYILGGCILILIFVYLLLRKRKNKPIFPLLKEKKKVLPPHLQAIQSLDGLKEQKLWQQGREKEYHSQISDIVRIYIEGRFQVYAMEMTSEETLRNVRGLSDADFVFNNLQQILQLADWVKFAKYRPLPEENELSMMNAYLFVNNTMPVQLTEEKENE